MKYINQNNYPDKPYITRVKMEGEEKEKGTKTTVKTSACGLCSAVMVADRLVPNCEFSLDDAIELSYKTEANSFIGTSYKFFAPAFAEKFNLIYETTSDVEVLKNWLTTGGVAVANVGGDREDYIGVFSHNGHYVVVNNLEDNNRVAILDPSYWEGKYNEESRQGKVEMKQGVIAVCDISVLQKDAENRNPSFHLFKRK